MRLVQLCNNLQNRIDLEADFTYLERYVNDVKGNFSNFSDVDPQYSPESDTVEFNAPFVCIDKRLLKILQDCPSQKLCEAVFLGNSAIFVCILILYLCLPG